MKYSAHFNEFLNTILRRIIVIFVIFFTYFVRSIRYDMTINMDAPHTQSTSSRASTPTRHFSYDPEMALYGGEEMEMY